MIRFEFGDSGRLILAGTGERRTESIARIAAFMSWFGIATAGFITFVLELAIQANLRESALDNGAFMVGMFVYTLTLLALSVALFRSFRLPRGAP